MEQQAEIFESHVEGSVELSLETVHHWLKCQRTAKQAARDLKLAKQLLMDELGAATDGHCGAYRFKRLSASQRKLDAKALLKAMPDLLDVYGVDKTTEVLDFTTDPDVSDATA